MGEAIEGIVKRGLHLCDEGARDAMPQHHEPLHVN